MDGAEDKLKELYLALRKVRFIVSLKYLPNFWNEQLSAKQAEPIVGQGGEQPAQSARGGAQSAAQFGRG